MCVVTFAVEKTQAMVYHVLERTWRNCRQSWLSWIHNIISLQDRVNIVGVKTNFLCAIWLLPSKGNTQSLSESEPAEENVSPPRLCLMTLYKASSSPVMEYAPLKWMSSACYHLSMLDKVTCRKAVLSRKTVLCNALLLKVWKSHSSTHQRTFSSAVVSWWNSHSRNKHSTTVYSADESYRPQLVASTTHWWTAIIYRKVYIMHTV